MDDFYAARSGTIPPLPWTNFAPPLSESASRPTAGIVEFEHTCLNQNDEVVAVCRRMGLMRKRPAA